MEGVIMIEYPVMKVQMIDVDKIVANDYNPNVVPSERMKALKKSFLLAGLTMPVVVNKEGDKYVLIDGYHRFALIKNHFKMKQIPATVLDLEPEVRIACTMLHNTARGEHIVDLEAQLVKRLVGMGKSMVEIADLLQLEGEEALRLNANTTLKDRFEKRGYSSSWE